MLKHEQERACEREGGTERGGEKKAILQDQHSLSMLMGLIRDLMIYRTRNQVSSLSALQNIFRKHK